MRTCDLACFPSLLLAISMFACGDPPADPVPPAVVVPREAGASVAYDQVWQLGSHNSFWIERQGGDPFASGPKERILDQLFADRMRSLEFDVHHGTTPHDFRVYHAVPGDSLCGSLQECLGMVRLFHRTMPQHHPIIIYLEFKELFQPLFDEDYTPEDLDRILDAELGPLIYRPAEFLEPCAAAGIKTLAECATSAGWPSVAELRGRFIVAPLGNWNMYGGLNSVDWVTYATAVDISARTGFPMISSWHLDRTNLDASEQERISDDAMRAAYAQSIFMQGLAPDDENALRAVSQRRIVRMDKAFSVEEQQRVLIDKVQVIQTDTPWIRYDAEQPELSLHAFSSAISAETLREPEARLTLVPNRDDSRLPVFASTQVDAGSSTTWETLIAVGNGISRVGCLRAARDPDFASPVDEMSLSLCRHLLPTDIGPDAGKQVLRLSTCSTGGCTTEEYKSEDGAVGGSGELIALDVKIRDGQTCIIARSARTADAKLSPQWTTLGSERCLPAELRHQGLSRLGIAPTSEFEPVYFFNTQRNGRSIAASDLSVR